MKTLVQNIGELSQRVGRDVKLMEVCGTHTMAAFRSGLRQLLPDGVRQLRGIETQSGDIVGRAYSYLRRRGFH